MSGLSLKYIKSCFISWNANDHGWVVELARKMACIHSKCPVLYLGVPIGDNMNKCSAWKPILWKIQNKLASWKARTLSRAGRLTLIKSVLNSLLVYYMSLFKMPKAIAHKIVNLQRKFFWGGSNAERLPMPTIKWSSIVLPKSLGGLGIGDIMYKNLILLFKLW